MSTTAPRTSLTAPTEAMRADMKAQIGELLDQFDEGAVELGARRFPAKRVGDVAPEFTLPDAQGRDVSLADLRAHGPVVLVFYRGAWCPYCNLQLNAFQAALGDIRAAGATLVAISPQTPDASLSFAEKANLEFIVLSDQDNAVARSYGLVWTLEGQPREVHVAAGVDLPAFNGDLTWELPAASTFVVGKDGMIAFASVSADYRWRVGPEEVLAALGA